jgi:hypothetical protein
MCKLDSPWEENLWERKKHRTTRKALFIYFFLLACNAHVRKWVTLPPSGNACGLTLTIYGGLLGCKLLIDLSCQDISNNKKVYNRSSWRPLSTIPFRYHNIHFKGRIWPIKSNTLKSNDHFTVPREIVHRFNFLEWKL